MLTNWLTFRAVALSLDGALAGREVIACLSQEKNELLIELGEGGHALHLQFGAHPQRASLLLRPEFARARKNSVDLFPALPGARVASVAVHGNDRMIRIGFRDGRSLVFAMHSQRANAWLLDEDGVVTAAFKQKHPLPAHDRNWTGELPGEEQLRRAVADPLPELPAMKFLPTIRPWIAGTFAREVCFRAGLDPVLPVQTGSVPALLASACAAIDEASRGAGRLYFTGGVPAHFAIVELLHLGAADMRIYDTVHAALYAFIRGNAVAADLETRRSTVLGRLDRAISRIDRTSAAAVPPAHLLERADQYEKYANLLLINPHESREQPRQITLPDIFTDPRLVVCIPLDGTGTLLQNAQRYFDKARQSRAAAAHTRERGAMLRKQKEKLCTLRDEVAHAGSLQELKVLMNRDPKMTSALGVTARGEKDEQPFLFRRFVVQGGFEVWVGKNSANNDELTVRHARPNDLWFHARGVGGSHAVLKVGSAQGEPSREAIRAAASIAAWYSKHRNAKSVPVAYTEKKYVVKPRGVPAGTVLLQREKVLMVPPKLPENPAGAEGAADTE